MTITKAIYPDFFRQMSQRSSLFSYLPERLQCSLCHKVMIEPIQTTCGCRFCMLCIGNYISQGGLQCPNNCEESIERDRLTIDKAVEREIMNLETKCINAECTDTFLFKNIQEHLSVCGFKLEQCKKCQLCYAHRDKEVHELEKCNMSVVKCLDCNKEMTREEYDNKHRNYQDHSDICPVWIRDCPYQCDGGNQLYMHLHLKDCPKKPTECPFKEIGCSVVSDIDSLDLHLKNDASSHEILMMSQIEHLRQENSEMRSVFLEKQETLDVELLQYQTQSERIEDLRNQVKQMEDVVKKLSTELEICRQHLNEDLVLRSGEATWTIRNIREKIAASKIGGTSHIISDSFYVDRPGYNLSMKVYLNGDGRGKDTCLSVYFVINKGDYDDQLLWPFQRKVTLCLLRNAAGREHVTVSMKPDQNLACYGKPSSAYNVGAGQPEFAKLSEILSHDFYLHNGALKLMLTLNPAI